MACWVVTLCGYAAFTAFAAWVIFWEGADSEAGEKVATVLTGEPVFDRPTVRMVLGMVWLTLTLSLLYGFGRGLFISEALTAFEAAKP